ncbi:MAG: polysaccharide biosynthesis tyrosine autokinase [Pseudomonadota bacterium]
MRSIPISTQRATVPENDDTIDILQLLGTLRRGKWRIMAYTLIAAALSIYYAIWMTTPVYTAVSNVALNQRNSDVVDLASPLAALDGSDYYAINTEVETLQSRDLSEKLVRHLNLVEDPMFNYDLRPPTDDTFSARALIRQAIQAISPPKPVVDAPEPTEAELEAKTFEDVVDAVMGSLSASNVPESYVFAIEVTTEDPATSMRVANAMAEVYIEDQIAVKYDATEKATDWLRGRVSELETELETAENKVKAFNAETDLVGPETLEALNRQLKDRRERIGAVQLQADQLETRVAGLLAANQAGDRAKMVALADDAALRQLLPRLSDVGAQETFDTRFGQILDRAQIEATRAQAQIQALGASVKDLESQVQLQSAELLKLEQLEREAGASRQIYEYFLSRLKETSVQQGVHSADSRILSRAVLPTRPSAPRKSMIVIMATFFGFMTGCILVLVHEMRQTGFRSAQEAEQATGITVFAQIPKAPFSRRKRILNYLATKPTSAMVEAVRNLRTSVLLSNMDNPPQVIMMTSSLPGEGKTTQSLALAQSFAGMEKKVLLIEGDIRRRTFQEYFNVRGRSGLVTAVAGEVPLDEVVVHSEELGVDVLIGEKSTVNAADFFSSGRFRTFLSQLRSRYDVIIIDTPPVLVVPDARVIGPLADAVIYAIHWNKTTRAQLEEGVHSLQSVEIKISGLSLNQIDMRKAQSYGGKYGELYGYNYGRKYYNN